MPNTNLEAVRKLQAIEDKLQGVYIDLQQVAVTHPDHITAVMVEEYGEAIAMIGAAKLKLQKDAGLNATDDRV